MAIRHYPGTSKAVISWKYKNGANRMKRIWAPVGLALILLSALVSGCSSLPNALYTTYSLKRTVQSFSLEYPTYYRLLAIDTFGRRDKNGPLKVQFARTKRVSGLTNNFFEITIGSGRPDQVLASAAGIAGDVLVLERNPTRVAGVPAETVVFSSTGFFGKPTVTRSAFLEVDQASTWSIALRCEESGVEQGKVDFQHVIDTFKILP